MKNTDPGFDKAIAKAIKDKLNGVPSKQIIDEGPLSHSQFELAFWRQVPLADGGLKELVGSCPADEANAIALRDYFQVSWGQISILMDVSESQVRRLYRDGSGNLSQGKRIGHGGRWYLAERELYTDGLQRPGTEIPKEHEGRSIREQAILSATEQKMIHKDIAQLREMAQAAGIAPGRSTKAQLVRAILKAKGGEAPAKPKRARKATKK